MNKHTPFGLVACTPLVQGVPLGRFVGPCTLHMLGFCCMLCESKSHGCPSLSWMSKPIVISRTQRCLWRDIGKASHPAQYAMLDVRAQVSEVASKARETTAEAYHAAVESAEAAVRAAREKVSHVSALVNGLKPCYLHLNARCSCSAPLPACLQSMTRIHSDGQAHDALELLSLGKSAESLLPSLSTLKRAVLYTSFEARGL